MKQTNQLSETIRNVVLLIMLCLSAPGSMAAQQIWLIKSAEVLDIVTGNVLSNHDVLVEKGLITRVARDIKAPDAHQIPAKDHFLVPGWVEMHAHVPPNQVSKQELEELLFLYSAYGITTVRGMLGSPWHLELREQLNRSEVSGPALITSGPSFNGRSVNSPTFAAGRVKAQFDKGYDFLKVHPGMSDSEFRSMAQAATKLGLDFSGHITSETGLLNSARLGQGTIDHLDGVIVELAIRSGAKDLNDTGFFGSAVVDLVDKTHIPKLAKELAETGIALVPTESLMIGFVSPTNSDEEAKQSQYQLVSKNILNRWKETRNSIQNSPGYSEAKAQRFFEVRKAFINAFHQAGGTILIGSDAPQVFNVPGDAIHHEMKIMVESGLTPLAVLQSASLHPAEFFKQTNNGKVSEGYQANLVLLKQNPLRDIRNTREIVGVMTRGQWLKENTIKSRLEQIRESNR